MLKPLTMSLGLGFALGMTSLGVAGHHKAMPTAQGPAPSPQGVVASAQDVGCGDVCGPVKKGCGLFDLFKPKPKCYEYEWVLKKKRVHHFGGLFGGHKGGGLCGGDTCGEVYPSAQYPSAQGGPHAAPQGAYYGSGQYADYGSGQVTGGSDQGAGSVILNPTGTSTGAGATTTPDASTTIPEVPRPPAERPEGAGAATDEAKGEASNGGLLLLSPTGN
jgi:hypothetical protein